MRPVITAPGSFDRGADFFIIVKNLSMLNISGVFFNLFCVKNSVIR